MSNSNPALNEARAALADVYRKALEALVVISNLDPDDRAELPKDIEGDLHFMTHLSYEAAFVHNVGGRE